MTADTSPPANRRRRDAQLRYWILPALVLFLGVLASCGLWRVMRATELAAIQKEFRASSIERVAVFRAGLARPIDLIQAVESLYKSSESVDRSEFQQFLATVDPAIVGIDSIRWVESVSGEGRQEYEQRVGRIMQRQADGSLQTAEEQAHYWPITYVFPEINQASVLGENVDRIPAFRDAFVRARQSQQIATFTATALASGSPGLSILLVDPIAAVDQRSETPPLSMRGYLVAKLRIDKVLENAISSLVPVGIEMQLYESAASPKTRVSYVRKPRLVSEHPDPSRSRVSRSLAYDGQVQIADRLWTLHCTAGDDYLERRRNFTPTTALASGIVASFLISGFIGYLLRRTKHVERLIDTRTFELRAAKLVADEQIARQVALENELQLSREQLDLAVRGNNDGIWDWNLDSDEVFYSPRFLEMLGFARDEFETTFDAMLSLIHPDQLPRVHQEIDRCRNGHANTFEIEYQIRNKDNRYLNVLSRAVAVCHAGQTRPFRMVGTQVDLTKWKQHELELNQFKTTLDQTHDCVFMFRPDSLRFYYVNRGAIEYLGYSADEMKQLTMCDVDALLATDVLSTLFDDLVAGRQDSRRLETRYRRKDGTEVPADVFIQYVAPDGEPPRFVAIVRDISDRKLVEQRLAERTQIANLTADVGIALSQAEQLQRGLQQCCEAIVDRLDACFARIWTVDASATVLDLQASAGLYTHIDGSYAHVPVGESRIGRIAALAQPHLTNDVATDSEIGGPDWIQREGMVAFAGYPLIVGDRVNGVMALFARQPLQPKTLAGLAAIADTTALFVERKRAEDELLISHREISKLSLVASKTQHSVFITDAQRRIEWVNDAFTLLTGFASQDVVGRRPEQVLHGPETNPATVKEIIAQLGARKSVSTEIYNYTKRGQGYWADLKVDPVFNEVGQLTNFVVTQVDITERKASEQALLVAKEEAERASSAKSEFLATMSHELRTPLNGVIGMTELLADSPLDARQRRFVSACQSSGNALLTLISDILDLSRIEAGGLELEEHPFDLLQLLDDLMESMPARMINKPIELLYRLDHPHTLQLAGDSHRLRQVLMNLMANAIKFTERGQITLGVKLQNRSDDRIQLLFSIQDSGIGIPAERLEHVFDSFSQVDSSISRRYGGSGLGLSISKAIVEAMGGEIGVHSSVGVGSRFWFSVNFRRSNPTAPLIPANTASRLQSLRVLLIQPHAGVQQMLIAALCGWGIAVDTVGDFQSGLRQMNEASDAEIQYDLLIVDAECGEDLDHQLADALRQNPSVCEAAVFLVASSLSSTVADPAIYACCLHKPIGQSQLYAALVDQFCHADQCEPQHS